MLNVSEDQEKDARKVVFGCFQLCFGHRASMRSPIKRYKEQGWEKKRGEHSFLNGCSFRGAGITATEIKIGAQHEVLNVFGILDLLGVAPSGASLFSGLFENPCKNKRQ